MWRALAQYARPAFIRNNTPVFMALFTSAWWTWQLLPAGSAPASRIHFYEFMPEYLAQAVAFQLRRQTTTSISQAIPGFGTGERYAAAVLIAGVFLLALFFMHLGNAPLVGACAYVAVLVITGILITPVDKSMPPVSRALHGAKIVPALLMVFMAPVRSLVLHLPFWIALPVAFGLMATALAVILHERKPRAGGQKSGKADVSILLPRKLRLSTMALPAAVSMPLGYTGEIGLRLAMFCGAVVLIAPSSAIGLSTQPSLHAMTVTKILKILLISATPVSLAFGGLISTGWMFDRSEWPALFATGFHGTREGFARAMTHAFARRIAVSALTNATIATTIEVTIGVLPLPQAASAWLAIVCLLFGTALLPCLAVLRSSLASGVLGHILRGLAVGIAALLASFVLISPFQDSPAFTLANRAACAFALLAGLVILTIVPRRLARLDWPLM